MSKCEECGNTYYERKCPHCEKKEWKQTLNKNNKIDYEENKIKRYKNIYTNDTKLTEKEKLFKTIRYAIIFFIGLLIIGVIGDIIITNYMFKSFTPSINNMNEMSKDAMEANKKIFKQLEEIYK